MVYLTEVAGRLALDGASGEAETYPFFEDFDLIPKSFCFLFQLRVLLAQLNLALGLNEMLLNILSLALLHRVVRQHCIVRGGTL